MGFSSGKSVDGMDKAEQFRYSNVSRTTIRIQYCQVNHACQEFFGGCLFSVKKKTRQQFRFEVSGSLRRDERSPTISTEG